jgi:hypothetical protein
MGHFMSVTVFAFVSEAAKKNGLLVLTAQRVFKARDEVRFQQGACRRLIMRLGSFILYK